MLHTLEETKRKKEVSEVGRAGGAGLQGADLGGCVLCHAGGGEAGLGEGEAAGGEAGGVQRDDAVTVGGVQALPQAHLHACLL